MVAGAYIRSLRGEQGQITVPGIGAVVAEFQSWNLQRHEESRSVDPVWTLHAVFRYQNDLLLTNDKLTKRIRLQLNEETKIDLCNWRSLKVEGRQLIAEGVVQCPTS
jgi:hypothetical protein